MLRCLVWVSVATNLIAQYSQFGLAKMVTSLLLSFKQLICAKAAMRSDH